ncbi:uncharacterized protein [Amphiura filiformis]|uniref:uncharacterized protein n=1 Tax=Amphiura filiformis TaxID=82378 RepID=UPI003B2165E8
MACDDNNIYMNEMEMEARDFSRDGEGYLYLRQKLQNDEQQGGDDDIYDIPDISVDAIDSKPVQFASTRAQSKNTVADARTTNSHGVICTSKKLRWGSAVLMIIVISNILTGIGVYVNVCHRRQYPEQKDINECTSSTDNCDANAACTNTTGSFTCACNAGYSGDGITCTG